MELVKRLKQEWEYEVFQYNAERERDSLESKLNQFGERGWELVSAKWLGDGIHFTCIFKRPK